MINHVESIKSKVGNKGYSLRAPEAEKVGSKIMKIRLSVPEISRVKV